tara:strand:+ start:160 stop:537 length:378 start_codon:yes stop_codon:yes gene_type:complete
MGTQAMNEAQLERLCDLYIENKIKDRGYTLEQFLENHRSIISSVVFNVPAPLPIDEDFYPLLPAQRKVMDKLDREAAFDLMGEQFEYDIQRHTSKEVIVSMSNGCMKESMHHRHYPNAGKVHTKK